MQYLDHIGGPTLNFFQYVHVSLVYGGGGGTEPGRTGPSTPGAASPTLSTEFTTLGDNCLR